jgi:hypothetical protein
MAKKKDEPVDIGEVVERDQDERKSAEALFPLQPNVSRATRAAMPGMIGEEAAEPEACEVTINGVKYTWTADTADTVPAEALEVWRRYKAANS